MLKAAAPSHHENWRPLLSVFSILLLTFPHSVTVPLPLTWSVNFINTSNSIVVFIYGTRDNLLFVAEILLNKHVLSCLLVLFVAAEDSKKSKNLHIFNML